MGGDFAGAECEDAAHACSHHGDGVVDFLVGVAVEFSEADSPLVGASAGVEDVLAKQGVSVVGEGAFCFDFFDGLHGLLSEESHAVAASWLGLAHVEEDGVASSTGCCPDGEFAGVALVPLVNEGHPVEVATLIVFGR